MKAGPTQQNTTSSSSSSLDAVQMLRLAPPSHADFSLFAVQPGRFLGLTPNLKTEADEKILRYGESIALEQIPFRNEEV